MNARTAQHYARCIGMLYLITIVAGGWGESHVPDTLLLANDLAGTAHKVAGSVELFRSSFAAYLIEASCDITLNVLLYALLRPISRNLALLAVCFGLMGTATFAAGEMLYFAAALTGAGYRCCPGHIARGQGNAHLSLPDNVRLLLWHFCHVLWHCSGDTRISDPAVPLPATRAWRDRHARRRQLHS